MVRTVYQNPHDKGRWHVMVKSGDMARTYRLDAYVRTREQAEQDATRF